MTRHETQAAQVTSLPGDDFKRIHGIGPAIDARLNAAGIHSFGQLASLSPDEVVLSLGSVIGLTVKRVEDQNWIGQAGELASAEIQNASTDTGVRQHFASFTVEFLLDEENRVRRTHIIHNKSKNEDTWAGWDETRLIDFFIRSGGFPINQPMMAATKVVPDRSASIETTAKTDKIGGNLHISEVSILSIQTGHQGRILASNQPFEISPVVDLTGLALHGKAPLFYNAHIFAKSLSDGSRLEIGNAKGNIIPQENLVFFEKPRIKGRHEPY